MSGEKMLSWLQQIWNSPNTLVGLVIGLLNGSWPQISHGAINFYMQGGPVKLICRGLGISAFTVGECVLYAVEPTDFLRVHEGRHIWQYRRLGPFFLPVYFTFLIVYGYVRHPLERDARNWELREFGKVGPSDLVASEEQQDL